MARRHVPLIRFTTGEVTPRLGARIDTEAYQSGAAELRNALVTPFGGVQARGGTKLIDAAPLTPAQTAAALARGETPRLSTIHAPTGSRVIAHLAGETDQGSRAYADDVAAPEPVGTMISVTGAPSTVGVVPGISAHRAREAAKVQLDSVTYFAHPEGNYNLVHIPANPAGPAFFRYLVPAQHTLLFFGSLDPYIAPDALSPSRADLPGHQRYRTGPWLPAQFFGGGLRAVPIAGSPTMFHIYEGANATTPVTASDFVLPLDPSQPTPALQAKRNIGRLLAIDTHVYQITGFEAGSFSGHPRRYLARVVNTGTGDVARPTTGYDVLYRPGAFSLMMGAYAVAHYNGRLWYGGTPEMPYRVWASSSGKFGDFDDGLLAISVTSTDNVEDFDIIRDDRSFSLDVSVAGGQNAIVWLAATQNRLLVGCVGGEVEIASPRDGVITPKNARAVSAGTNRGAARVQPVVVDNRVIYVGRGGRHLRALAYSFEQDSLVAPDISLTAEHLFEAHGPIVRLAYQQTPTSVVWALHADGTLTGVTIETAERVTGFHHHELQGAGIDDIVVRPSADEDEVWAVVRDRGASSPTQFTIQRITRPFHAALPPRAPYLKRREVWETRVWQLDQAVAFVGTEGPVFGNPVSASPGTFRIETDDGLVLPAPGSVVRLSGFTGELPGDPLDADGVPLGITYAGFIVAETGSNYFDLTAPPGMVLPIIVGPAKWLGPRTTISGLGHLANKSVLVFGDGMVFGSYVVGANGVLDFPGATRGIVGVPFEVVLETLDLTIDVGTGTSIGQPGAVFSAAVVLLDSAPVMAATPGTPGEPSPAPGVYLNADPDDRMVLFSGAESVPVHGGHTTSPRVRLTQPLPLPFHVLGVAPHVERNAR